MACNDRIIQNNEIFKRRILNMEIIRWKGGSHTTSDDKDDGETGQLYEQFEEELEYSENNQNRITAKRLERLWSENGFDFYKNNILRSREYENLITYLSNIYEF
jgi:hypothetical protein